MPYKIAHRPVVAGDEVLLVRATLGNLNWSGTRFTEADVIARPELSHYTRMELARGDFGLVAEHGEDVVGVAWALFLPADDAGYGFVDKSVPEISLWVRGDWRGRGVGRRLLRRLQQVATDRGIARLSLSVETGNHARDLYVSEGFRPVEGREPDGVMVRES